MQFLHFLQLFLIFVSPHGYPSRPSLSQPADIASGKQTPNLAQVLEVSHFKHPEPSLFIFIPGNAWEGISHSDAFSNFAQESLKEQQKPAEDLLCLEIKHLRGVSWQQGFSNQNIYNLPFIHHLPSGRTPKLFPGSRNHHQPPLSLCWEGKNPIF